YVVHVNYGIGLFKGIERVKAMGTERDYIKLEYAGEEFAFVPIEQVNMVQRYIGSENEKPRLDMIGSKSWSARKAKVQQKVEEIAHKLIDLYSKRTASRGYPFPKDGEWQSAFEAAFPYEDTPDQFAATQDIKADMEKAVPMDRLVCGDVGYGKTEIAMRAAFKAVMGGKQVAFLAPTTILAEQHYENCKERFKNFPVQIAQLSRFVPPAEQKKTLQKLREGQVDILIGTHKILQKDVVFKDLGLMIIDEEQRFGVKDKEKLKVIKTNIDCLALSATPIPRTLHMSLLKIRDMSLLTTPPQNRQSIETAIEPFSDEKVALAIRRETERGGQVFYLHNRVESLEETRIRLEHIVPEMMIEVAHGQMTSEELDDKFRRFKMGAFHILVATTIIENGIDIPNVNTIIIDRADMYGVSQLYQLRGRVGRSDRKAYAYLFYPENKALSEVAMKRLQVISDFTELGSGFKIAMKDMEIRGAGNLLGRDQSGEVYAVGFEMYLTLLNNAIERLSNSDWHAPQEVLLELEYSGFIPDSYITEAQTKMEMYKRIASVGSDEELNTVMAELFDRFGPLPDEVNSLLCLAKIRILCNKLSITSLKEKNGLATIEFGEVAKISIDKLLKLIKANSSRIKLDPQKPNRLLLQTGAIDLKSKSEFIKEKLEQLY
ncbi:MAG: transcription-repair coupling factor, partial [Treponema sp.]|nr:transcription-repair coupling factor [Treponema sp.]